MKKILFALAFISLAACSHSSDDSRKPSALNSNGGNGTQEKTVNTTDYTACNLGRPATSLEGTWQLTQQSQDFDFVMTIDIHNGFFSLQNECSLQNRSLTASVSTPARYDAFSLTTLADQEDNEKIDEANFQMNCSASVKAAQMTYSFQGSCLVLQAAGETDKMVLVPR